MNSNLLLVAQAGFVLLTVIFFWLLMKELKAGIEKTSWEPARKKKYFNRILISIIIWMILVSVWSGSGIMADFTLFPLNFAPVIVIPLISILLWTFSRNLGEVLIHIPAANIIRLQVFRFFVELLLWTLFVALVLPEQMTFEGRNFDILAGITAPLIAWLVSRKKISKTGVILWNVVCLGLLINIVTVAILSVPSPIRVFMNEPANTIVASFPISWLPGFLVPLAYTLHFLSLRQITKVKSSDIPNP
jgi:hypothetical protein